MLAEDPPVSAVPPPVRVTRPRQLLSLVPALLGYYPQASVVVLGVSPPQGTLRVSQRCPGYDPGDPYGVARAVRAVVALLGRQLCQEAAAVGYGPAEQVAPFFGLLQEQAVQIGIEVTELLRAEDSRYWSYACANPACCPPGGSPYDDTPDPALAALLPDGVPGVLPGREALAGLVAPCGGDEAALVARAVRAAGERAARLTGRARQSADPMARRYPLAGGHQGGAGGPACLPRRPRRHPRPGWLATGRPG